MVTLLVLAACLFVVAFVFGKRFGLPILGLAAGLVVAQYQSSTAVAVAAPYLKQYVTYLPAALVILPSFVLIIFMKSRHRTLPVRVLSSAVFAAAGLVFVVVAPGTPVSLSGNFPAVTSNAGLIVTGLLVLATLEAAFGRASKKKFEESKK